jgi:hypothetical protein
LVASSRREAVRGDDPPRPSGPEEPPDGFWCGWPVAQRAVRPDPAVFLPPPFDQYLHLPQGVEDLTIEELVMELPDDLF